MAKSPIPSSIHNTQLLLSMNRRRGRDMVTTSRALQTEGAPVSGTARANTSAPATSHASTAESIPPIKLDLPVEDPDKPSVDLKKRLRGYLARLAHIPAKIRRLKEIINPPLTPDQIEALAIKNEELKRDNLAYKEAVKMGQMVSRKLAQLGLRERMALPQAGQEKSNKRMKMVRWDMATRDEGFNVIKLRMNTDPRYLPEYVKVSELGNNQLYTDELLPTLKHFCNFSSDDYGVVLTIFRHGLDGLPEYVTAEELWRKMPGQLPNLAIAAGFGNNSKRVYFDLDDCPHLLVCGATKWGKSNFINLIISYWLHQGLTPEDLKLVLFDLKRGLEFNFYDGLPHLYRDEVIPTGIVEELSQVLPVMNRLQVVRDARMDIIKRAGFKDFNTYNRSQTNKKKRLPAIVIIFDEWAKIRLSRGGLDAKSQLNAILKLADKTSGEILETEAHKSPKHLLDLLVGFAKDIFKMRQTKHFGLEAENMLAEFTNLARAAGMYVILSTQNPSKEVLSGLIKVNFSTTIAMRLSIGGSLAALGTQSATRLEVKGRAILLDGGEEQTIQTPFISDSLIKALVYKAITGKDIKSTQIDIEEILEYSLNNMAGELDILRLYDVFRVKHVRKNWLTTALREAEGQTFILSGDNYIVLPRGSHKPRRLERKDIQATPG